MGTRFVATLESAAHPVYKRALPEAVEADTVYAHTFDGGWPGAPHRVLRNSPDHAQRIDGAAASMRRAPARARLSVITPTGPRSSGTQPTSPSPAWMARSKPWCSTRPIGRPRADMPSAADLVPGLANQSREALTRALSAIPGRSCPGISGPLRPTLRASLTVAGVPHHWPACVQADHWCMPGVLDVAVGCEVSARAAVRQLQRGNHRATTARLSVPRRCCNESGAHEAAPAVALL